MFAKYNSAYAGKQVRHDNKNGYFTYGVTHNGTVFTASKEVAAEHNLDLIESTILAQLDYLSKQNGNGVSVDITYGQLATQIGHNLSEYQISRAIKKLVDTKLVSREILHKRFSRYTINRKLIPATIVIPKDNGDHEVITVDSVDELKRIRVEKCRYREVERSKPAKKPMDPALERRIHHLSALRKLLIEIDKNRLTSKNLTPITINSYKTVTTFLSILSKTTSGFSPDQISERTAAAEYDRLCRNFSGPENVDSLRDAGVQILKHLLRVPHYRAQITTQRHLSSLHRYLGGMLVEHAGYILRVEAEAALTNKGKAMSKVGDILRNAERKQHRPGGKRTIYTEWRDGLVRNNHFRFVPEMTQKEKGMLKTAWSRMGVHGFEAVSWFLDTYRANTFTYRKHGIFVPEKPTIPFLLKNVMVIYNLYLSSNGVEEGADESMLPEDLPDEPKATVHQLRPAVRDNMVEHREVTAPTAEYESITVAEAFAAGVDFDFDSRHEPLYDGRQAVPMYNFDVMLPIDSDTVPNRNARREELGVMGREVIDTETGEVVWSPFVVGNDTAGYKAVPIDRRRDFVKYYIGTFGKDTAQALYIKSHSTRT